MDVHRQFALNLVQLWKERRLSQEAPTLECGLHRTYISGVERGVRNPTVLVLERIAIALDVPPALLLKADRRVQ